MSARGMLGPTTIAFKAGVAFTEAEWATIITLCAAAFAEDFAQHFTHFARTWHVLVHRSQLLVSHACWVERSLRPAGLPPLRPAYIEAVATLPAWQRQGYGTLAMMRIAEEIAGYDLGALSPAAEEFYERLGWEDWRGPTAIRTAAGSLPTPDEQIMILRLPQTPSLDLDAPISAEWRAGDVW